MKDITIRDIARLAGVSTTAVSYVLNGKKGVSPQTRDKINRIIEQTGFMPNVHTRRLNLKKSFNINLAISLNFSPITNLFYLEILQGIFAESKNYDYNLVLIEISEHDREKRLVNNILNNDVDGIIFVQDPSSKLIAKVTELESPFLVVDTQTSDPDFTTVQTDYVNAAKTSVEYLIRKGHKKIAYIGMQSNPNFHLNTFTGYSQAMELNRLSIMPGWIQPGAYDEDSSYKCMQNILESADVPTAVYCAADVFAFGAMKCVWDNGLSVPDDISFMGMDDAQVSKYTRPPLTTLYLDEEYMGRSAMKLIDKMIKGEDFESVNISSTHIKERDSVKQLN